MKSYNTEPAEFLSGSCVDAFRGGENTEKSRCVVVLAPT